MLDFFSPLAIESSQEGFRLSQFGTIPPALQSILSTGCLAISTDWSR
ncbi:MAG TPA: hypothetical protein V6D34_13265 [Candidatus Sericytochromatia bacterium]